MQVWSTCKQRPAKRSKRFHRLTNSRTCLRILAGSSCGQERGRARGEYLDQISEMELGSQIPADARDNYSRSKCTLQKSSSMLLSLLATVLLSRQKPLPPPHMRQSPNRGVRPVECGESSRDLTNGKTRHWFVLNSILYTSQYTAKDLTPAALVVLPIASHESFPSTDPDDRRSSGRESPHGRSGTEVNTMSRARRRFSVQVGFVALMMLRPTLEHAQYGPGQGTGTLHRFCYDAGQPDRADAR
jgi:hypothetical protein